MSGIAGIVHFDGRPVKLAELEAMSKPLMLRAPDQRVCWVRGNLGFVHCLLQTIPNSNDERPRSNARHERFWVVLDGWVDNRAEVRRLLGAKNEDGPDESDADLVLRAYRKWGASFPKSLSGDFAIAIWDEEEARLYCARDHFGIRPMVYARVGQSIYFASDIEAILAIAPLSRELDEVAVGDLLVLGAFQETDATIYSEIKRVPPAHYLVASQNLVQINRYWSLNDVDPHTRLNIHEYVDGFRESFDRAVQERSRHQGMASQLSGGMDCTSVAALVSQRRNDLLSYTVTMGGLDPKDEEADLASLVSDYIDVPMKKYSMENYKLFEGEAETDIQIAEPLVGGNIKMKRDIYRDLASAGVRVLLTGQGGDALFNVNPESFRRNLESGNYFRLLRDLFGHLYSHRTLRGLGLRSALGMNKSRGWMPDFPPGLSEEFVSRTRLRERLAQAVEVIHGASGTHGQLLSPSIPSMFKEYEVIQLPIMVRHPFFDVGLVQYMMSVPNTAKSDKLLLRERMTGMLPEVIRTRPKVGLSGDPRMVRILRGDLNLSVDLMQGNESDPYIDIPALKASVKNLTTAKSDKSTWSSYHLTAPVGFWLWRQAFKL